MKHRNLPPLEWSSVQLFKESVFDRIKHDVTKAILVLINAEREGGQIDRDLLRHCVIIFEYMGMGDLSVYLNDLEAQLLDSTR